MKSYIVTLALLLALLSACSSSQITNAVSTLDKVEASEKLDICYVVWPPTIIKDPLTGELSGHFVDMANYLAKTMEITLAYKETSWSDFPADLNSGRCDLSIAGTYATIPRAKAVAFSRPISYIGNGAVIRKGSSLENIKNINGLDKEEVTIAVLNGEQGHEYVKQNFQHANIRVLQGNDLTLPLVEVVAGRADVGLADAVTTAQFTENQIDTTDLFAESPYDINPINWAVRQNDQTWLQFVNTAINYMESTGKIKEFESHYNTSWLRPKKEWVLT